jgi:hypothetical protein
MELSRYELQEAGMAAWVLVRADPRGGYELGYAIRGYAHDPFGGVYFAVMDFAE